MNLDRFIRVIRVIRGSVFSALPACGAPAVRSPGVNVVTAARNNAQNQLTGVGTATLDYDANGDLTTDETGKTLVYDAWNRLVAVKDSSGNTLESDTYDALGRRITQETSTQSTSTPALSDAGFESPSLGSGTDSYAYDPANTPWSYSGDAGVTGNDSAFTWDNPDAPEGTQVAFLQDTGSFSQTVAGLAAGSYELSFDVARRGYQAVVSGLPGPRRRHRHRHLHPCANSYYPLTTATFTVAAGSHTVTFQGLDSAGGDNTDFIDDVQLTSPTEPQTS